MSFQRAFKIVRWWAPPDRISDKLPTSLHEWTLNLSSWIKKITI